MRAVSFEQFGGPEVLREVVADAPRPGPGQVLVRVHAAGVNPVDGKIRSGIMEQIFPTSLPAIVGSELAGTVTELGEGVDHLTVGDAVFGWADTGSYAEYAVATHVVRKPEALSWEYAVSLPVATDAAERALDRLALTEGETLLVNGATGAVGTITVQLAVSRGITVIGTAGAANQDYLTSLGAIATTYGEGLVERVRALAPDGIDAVLDAAGRGALPDAIELRGGTDRIVTIADFAAGALGVVFESGPARRDTERLAEFAALAADGKLVTTVAATYPLAEAAEAQRVSDSGHVRGKLVLTVD